MDKLMWKLWCLIYDIAKHMSDRRIRQTKKWIKVMEKSNGQLKNINARR